MPKVKLGKPHVSITPAKRRETFNRVVMHAMIECGVRTQAELALQLGMTRQALSRRFTGVSDWSFPELVKLIEVLQIGPEGVAAMMGVALCVA